jgi:3-hydroxyisobutyrate dehydrogenase-like beta-hydroxyacid dehydrogenase
MDAGVVVHARPHSLREHVLENPRAVRPLTREHSTPTLQERTGLDPPTTARSADPPAQRSGRRAIDWGAMAARDQPVRTLGVLHPGEMGSAIAAAARGATVLWAPAGRSAATAARAEAAGLEGVSVDELVERSDAVLSICPPHAALEVAATVVGTGFAGLYVDANAISPATARAVADLVRTTGAEYVDGGVIGPPPRRQGSTRLCLSGPAAGRVAAVFEGSPLEVRVLGNEPDTASALKMCFAAWSKGSGALLLAVVETARAHGVARDLAAEWALSEPGLESDAESAASSAARKAWRWVGEMHEIADTFGAAGQPEGFHRAAAELYERIAAPDEVAGSSPSGRP